MEKEIELTIKGEPFGKERPRATKTGIIYTPGKTKSYEALIQETYVIKYGNRVFFEEKVPLEAEITACYGIPKSLSKRKKEEIIETNQIPMKKPDLDNVEKVCLDALNKLAYLDDAQICRIVSEKFFDEEPRVEIRVRERGKNG